VNTAAAERAWWSQAVMIGAVVALVLLPMGALGSRLGIWSFGTGFLFLGGGAVLALIGLLGGIVGAIVSMRTGRQADRVPLAIGVAVCVGILVFLGMQFNTARSVPPIHNISTDVEEPPAFDVVKTLRGAGSNPLDYDAATLAPLQQAAYPGVVPLMLTAEPGAVFDATLDVLSSLSLEIVSSDRETLSVEAVATTFWFGFKDDVVVRIRATPEGGSRVDVRSVSRVGQSDLGANAARIGRILDGLRAKFA
jgi:uncharacterized protein (DUF1499 family)